MNKSYRLWLLCTLVLLTAVSRWLPHPPNFTPLMAMALFSGALFQNWSWALATPLLAMLLSDWGLGFHNQMGAVYLSLAVAVGVGRWVGGSGKALNPLVKRLPVGILSSSVIFFALSNLSVWAFSGMYPVNGGGLVECYLMAIPFFHAEILGNLFYSGVLFGVWAAIRKWAPAKWTAVV